MLKGAIIGFGNVAVNGHLPGWMQRKDISISAVMDSDPARKKECARLLPDVRFYHSVDEMLGLEKLDFIDISTPPSTHAPLIKKCLKKNLHVLCEKPLVLSSSDLKPIAQLAKEKNKVLFTVHNWRFAPMVKTLINLIRQRKIGELKKLTWQVIRTKPSVTVPVAAKNQTNKNSTDNWRLNPRISGGGILIDHGWHAFYIIMELFGEFPTHAEGVFENRKYKDLEIEDTATVNILFPKGEAKALFTWDGKERSNRVEIIGSHGEIILENNYIVLTNSTIKETTDFLHPLSHGSHHPEWFADTANEFLTEIRKTDRRRKNFFQAAACLATLESCKKSHQQGGMCIPVTLPCIENTF